MGPTLCNLPETENTDRNTHGPETCQHRKSHKVTPGRRHYCTLVRTEGRGSRREVPTLSDDGVSGKEGAGNTASQPARRARLRCGRTAVGRVPRARDRAARYGTHRKRDARGFLVPKDRRGDDRALLGMDFPLHTSPFPKGPCIAMVLSKVKIKTRKINTFK